jgi:hypothetical protein
MATAELKVRIDAETGELKKGLDEATNLTTKFEKNIGTLTAQLSRLQKLQPFQNSIESFNRAERAIQATKAQINNLNASITGQGLSKLSANSNQAAFALNNLSRVAQDAPFGFIGIQNNLNPLLESFQALKKETGSTGGALKALGGSLMGAGGLGIALSVVSSAILFAQMGLRAWGVSAEKAAESTEDYAESLNQVTRAQLLGAQSAAQETTTLSLLFKQYQNGELTLEKRKSAYEELQRLYPAYFGNIAFEQEASVKTKNAYDKLTSSIIATARARAAGDLITKNSQRQLENEQKIIDLGIEASKAYQSALKAEEKAKLATASTGESGERIALSLISQSNTERKKATEIQKQINNLVTDSVILRDKNLQLEKSINTEIEKGAVLSGGIGGKAAPKLDPPKFERGALIQEGKTVGVTLSTGIAEGFKEAIPVVSFGLGENLKGGLTDWQTYVNNDLLPKVQTNFETFFNDILMRGKLSFESLGKAILNTFLSIAASDAARGLTNLFKFSGGAGYSNNLGSKVSGLAAIGKALGIGGGAAAGAAVAAGSLSGVAASTGGVILGSGVAAAGTAGAGTAGALATGTAATGGLLLPILGGIAAGALVASLFKKKQPAQPQPAFTTSNAISTSSSSNVDFGNGRVVFEISGVNLVGVLNRAGAKLQRFGP